MKPPAVFTTAATIPLKPTTAASSMLLAHRLPIGQPATYHAGCHCEPCGAEGYAGNAVYDGLENLPWTMCLFTSMENQGTKAGQKDGACYDPEP